MAELMQQIETALREVPEDLQVRVSRRFASSIRSKEIDRITAPLQAVADQYGSQDQFQLTAASLAATNPRREKR